MRLRVRFRRRLCQLDEESRDEIRKVKGENFSALHTTEWAVVKGPEASILSLVCFLA